MNRIGATVLVIVFFANGAYAVAAEKATTGKSASGSDSQAQIGARPGLTLTHPNNDDVPLVNQPTDRFRKLQAVLDKSGNNTLNQGGLGLARAGISTSPANGTHKNASVANPVRARKLPGNAVGNSEIIDVRRNGNQFDPAGD